MARSDKNVKNIPNPTGIRYEQVRSNRFTKFTPAQLEKAKQAGIVSQLAKLYGLPEDKMFTSTGKITYQGAEHSRGVLNKIKNMTARTYKNYQTALEFLCLSVGWTWSRIERARKIGAGPERKGWAGVHAYHMNAGKNGQTKSKGRKNDSPRKKQAPKKGKKVLPKKAAPKKSAKRSTKKSEEKVAA